LTEYSGEEVTAMWGSTTITGLTAWDDKTGVTATPLYQGGSRKVQTIKQKEYKPVTGTFTRRFSVYNSDWIVRMDATETAQTPVTITVQHLTGAKFSLNNAIVTDYDYKYSVPGGMCEEIVTFTATDKTESAS
jgi:hypothetical protein